MKSSEKQILEDQKKIKELGDLLAERPEDKQLKFHIAVLKERITMLKNKK